MNADEFRDAAHAAIEEIISYNASLPNLPVLSKISPGYLAPQLPATAPQEPQSWSEIQPDIASKIVPGITHWQSPNFMAFFPAGVTYPSVLAEMYSAAFTAPAFNWLCSPACTELETVVLDWLAKAFQLPESFLSTSENGGGGVIQGSASEAIVTCMVAARERYLHAICDFEALPALPSKEREDRMASLRPHLVALSSDQAHSSTQKAALIAGTRYRSIPTSWSNDLTLTGEAVQMALEECKAEGLHPYYLTTTLGTTNTCAVDDFAAIGATKRNYAPNMWVHVDAAHAGASLVLAEYSSKYSPQFASHVGAVDSFNMNMHKWLLVNFDASCLYVRNRNDLTNALSISPSYLQNKHTDSGLVTDYRDWQIPLGRRFRALKIWFVMRSYGISGLQAHIRHTIKLGEICAGLVKDRNDIFEILAGPTFALTCFRLRPSLFADGRSEPPVKGNTSEPTDPSFVPPSSVVEQARTGGEAETHAEAEQKANALTKQIADTVNEQEEIFITCSTTLGKTFIRVVSGNPQAEEKFVRGAFKKITKVALEALRSWRDDDRAAKAMNGDT